LRRVADGEDLDTLRREVGLARCTTYSARKQGHRRITRGHRGVYGGNASVFLGEGHQVAVHLKTLITCAGKTMEGDKQERSTWIYQDREVTTDVLNRKFHAD